MIKNESVWVQTGVLGFSQCIYTPRSRSVYTRVSQVQKWISDTVTKTSPEGSSTTSAPPTPTAPPTLIASPRTTTTASIALPTTTVPTTDPTCDSLFCSGENLIHFTQFTSLCVLVVLLHVFAGIVGK